MWHTSCFILMFAEHQTLHIATQATSAQPTRSSISPPLWHSVCCEAPGETMVMSFSKDLPMAMLLVPSLFLMTGLEMSFSLLSRAFSSVSIYASIMVAFAHVATTVLRSFVLRTKRNTPSQFAQTTKIALFNVAKLLCDNVVVSAHGFLASVSILGFVCLMWYILLDLSRLPCFSCKKYAFYRLLHEVLAEVHGELC